MDTFLVTVLLYPVILGALTSAPLQSPARDILAVIEKSAEDWNRGDIEAFAQCYEQSPDTTFVGTEVSRGMAGVLARYRRSYPDAAHMGKSASFRTTPARPHQPDHTSAIWAAAAPLRRANLGPGPPVARAGRNGPGRVF